MYISPEVLFEGVASSSDLDVESSFDGFVVAN